MSTIGERIRIRRIELNMSQEELAYKLGYKSKSSINKIELNLQDLRRSKIAEIADALDTTPSYIMGWDEEEPAPADNTSDPIKEKISSLLDQINEEGKERVLEYVEDMVAAGRFKKSNQSEMVDQQA